MLVRTFCEVPRAAASDHDLVGRYICRDGRPQDRERWGQEGGRLQTVQTAILPGLREADLVGLQESDIRLGLQRGGYIRNILVVSRPNKLKHAIEYVVWVHPSWMRGFYPFCTHRGRSMRSYKDPNLFFTHCRDDWGYRGGITIRLHNDPKVLAFQSAAATRAARRVADLLGNEALLD